MAQAVGIKDAGAARVAAHPVRLHGQHLPLADGRGRVPQAARRPGARARCADRLGGHARLSRRRAARSARVPRRRAPRRRSQAAARAAGDRAGFRALRARARDGRAESGVPARGVSGRVSRAGSGCSWSSRRISRGARCPILTTAAARASSTCSISSRRPPPACSSICAHRRRRRRALAAVGARAGQLPGARELARSERSSELGAGSDVLVLDRLGSRGSRGSRGSSRYAGSAGGWRPAVGRARRGSKSGSTGGGATSCRGALRRNRSRAVRRSGARTRARRELVAARPALRVAAARHNRRSAPAAPVRRTPPASRSPLPRR